MARLTKISPPKYTKGEVHTNQYTGMSFVEILNLQRKRVGWVWTTSQGRVIVSPHMGFYLWYNEGGEEWTQETAALWLINVRSKHE